MGKCVIFCAAEFDGLAMPVMPEDYLLAADGGLRHLQALGIQPHGILGDFDSLGYIPQGAQVFPVEKDDTDSMLAVCKGLDMGFTEFWIYGGLDGVRLDHTVANFQTLQFLADRGATGYLIGRDYLVTVIRQESIQFSEKAEGILSLFCLGADAGGIDLENLKYPLKDGSLTAGYPLGVSNQFVGKPAVIRVRKGSVLAMWDRAVGLPRRKKNL